MTDPVHAVIFDIDGTLLDSSAKDDDLYRCAVEKVLGAGIRFRNGLADYDNVTDSGILLQVFSDNRIQPEAALIDAVKNEFFHLLREFVDQSGPFMEIPGARSVLSRLSKSDRHGIAIATGGWRQSAEIKLATAGFNTAGLRLATADDAVTRTGIMQLALQSMAVEPAAITYFGDGTWDRDACRELGWTFRPVGPGLDGLLSFDNEFLSF
jgi:FMN phosphatase YigB (HAD superfamily)